SKFSYRRKVNDLTEFSHESLLDDRKKGGPRCASDYTPRRTQGSAPLSFGRSQDRCPSYRLRQHRCRISALDGISAAACWWPGPSGRSGVPEHLCSSVPVKSEHR